MQFSQEVDRAITELPRHSREVFAEVRDSAEFSCHPLHGQFQVKFKGMLVGGYNRNLQHWYLTKRFIDRTKGEVTAARHGFLETPRSSGAPFWRLDGAEYAQAFKAAVEDLTDSTL